MTSATGFNIQDFKSNIGKSGVLQTNKFLVSLSPPSGIIADPSLLQFRASDIRAPGVSLESLNVHRYGIGPVQKFPTNINFTDISITFVDDRNSSIWKSMNQWTQKIFSYGINAHVSILNPNMVFGIQGNMLDYKNNYTTDIIISIFNNEGSNIREDADSQAVLEIMLMEAYPVSMHDVPLSWSDNNNLFKTTVDFTFRSFDTL